MPGMSFVYDKTGDLTKKAPTILRSLDSVIHLGHYERQVLLSERGYFLGCTRYEEYSITTFENSDFLIHLEGQIYGKGSSTIEKELMNVAEYVFQAHFKGQDHITRWLLDTDGEFIIFALHKRSGNSAIINDALGRLPLYYTKIDGKLIVSREIRFIRSLVEDGKFDEMAIAQHLLFGYALGERTLFENIHRLQPATLIRVGNNENRITLSHLHRYNFEIKDSEDKKIEDNARELLSLFTEACRNRAESDNQNVVSLSGGLDSRSVAACLRKSGIPFFGASYLDFAHTTRGEVEVARQLSKVFDIDLRIFELPNPQGEDLLHLLRMKNGLNCLAMSFLLLFLEGIKQYYGSRGIRFITGDGGDHLLRDKNPYRNLRNVDDLVHYIISEHKIFSVEEVAALTRIQKSELIDEIKNHVLSYPEEDWNQKHVHFDIFERAFKWSSEGEDRNRFYLWSGAPFYSPKFLRYAMNCPDSQKSRYRLYRSFLLNLSPDASAIRNANWNLSITSSRYKIESALTDIFFRLSPFMVSKKRIKDLVRGRHGYGGGSAFIRCLGHQIDDRNAIGEYLSYPTVKEIVREHGKYSKRQIQVLFTLVSSIEETECGGSTIEKYYDAEFA